VATLSLSPARTLTRPRRADWRAILGVLLAILAGAAWLGFLVLTSDSRAVLVVARELPAGAVLASSDLASSLVRIDDSLYAAAVPASELDGLVGRQIAEPLHAQQILVRAQLATRPPLAQDQVALAIAINPDSAVGGKLRAGDHVQVLLTVNKGKPEAKTTVVLARALVYDVSYDTRRVTVGGTGSDGGQSQIGSPEALRSLTLVVTQAEAVELARARWAGELDVALLSLGQ
jgi:Flp pilus assembly protein CpaB